MKKSIFVFLILVFIFSACASVEAEVDITLTSTVSPTVTFTSTPSITPLPTIPTFTPTFDVSGIVTVTPAVKAVCPILQKNVNINLSDFSDYYPELITALNQGASIESIVNVFEEKINLNDYPNGNVIIPEKIRYEVIDVTNDGVREIILQGNSYRQRESIILSCSEGKYKILFSRKYPLDRTYSLPVDANQNGIVEIIIVDEKGSTLGNWFNLSVIEWNKDSFQTILSEVTWDSAFQYVQTDDLDKDKTKEIYWLFSDYLHSPPPWRRGTVIYKWNGEQFVLIPPQYVPAQYRFQSIQDGDSATLNGNFNDSLKAYQEAVFNEKLEWWSLQRQNDTIYKINNEGFSALGTPASGIPDPSEYPSLASYAYYRIMLIQLVQNQTAEANQTYQILLNTFGNDIYAKPYIEMATAFLEAYEVNQKMYDGCAAAIQYAVEHPDILIPLGSDYHGSQSKIYKPEDVCPFR
jgi:hypothetical protein